MLTNSRTVVSLGTVSANLWQRSTTVVAFATKLRSERSTAQSASVKAASRNIGESVMQHDRRYLPYHVRPL